MKNSITAAEARKLIDTYLTTETLRFHSRETEVIMRALARHFDEDEESWGLTGLLHDLDMDAVGGDPARHGFETIEILKREGYDMPELFEAILSHTESLGGGRPARSTQLHYALAAAENITGLITAYVLVRPDKTIAGAKAASVTKKLKDKSFAASVSREYINDIEKTGLERSAFIAMAIDAMTGIKDEIHM
ncbi:HD domain-containing protein [bacterium]|nr:HD domain-containing protein [bacterium]